MLLMASTNAEAPIQSRTMPHLRCPSFGIPFSAGTLSGAFGPEDAAGAGAAALWPQAAKAAIIQTLRNIANNFFISSLLHGFSCPYSNGKGRSTTSRAQRAAPLF